MKNKLSDLNNHLFAALERLGDEDLTPEQLSSEIRRSEAIANVSEQIVRTADLAIKAAKIMGDMGENQAVALLIEGTVK